MRDKLFGTNGIRGDADNFFTSKFCVKIGATFSAFLQERGKSGTIAIAMDPRPSSSRIKENLVAGLGQKWQITDQGIIPTPCLTYFIKSNNLAGGVMITGSHIEEQLNGLKFFFEGEEVSKQNEQEIEEIFFSRFKDKQVTTEIPKVSKSDEARQLYQKILLSLAKDDFSSLKIIVDAGNGTQSQIMPYVLRKLGANVVEKNCDLTKKMLTRDTEQQNSFLQLIETVKQEKADLAVTYDSDGDRAAFITNDGQFLPGGISASIIALSQEGDSIVTPINTSSVVEHIGKKVIRTKVGATYVAQKMKQEGIEFGFESNGGTISAEYHYGRDGGITTIKMLNTLSLKNQSLSQLVSSLPKYYIIKDKIDCPSNFNDIILKKAREKYKQNKVEDLDGLKIWTDEESWLLFRPSGNAPEFRVFAESKNENRAKELVKEGLDLVKEVINENN